MMNIFNFIGEYKPYIITNNKLKFNYEPIKASVLIPENIEEIEFDEYFNFPINNIKFSKNN